MDTLRFVTRAVDRPGSITCPHCAASVALPTSDPWLITGGVGVAPQLESLRCPTCRTRIYLHPVSADEQAQDAEWDALEEPES